MSGLRIIRKASGGGTWDEKEKIYDGTSCCVRKFKFKVKRKNKQQATNERMSVREYTMIEYTPNEVKPKYALCRITVVNKKNATSQQPQQQQGGTLENATIRYSNQSNLEMCIAQFLQTEELSECRKDFPKDYIVQIFSRMMDQIPAASPKEHSTEAAVRNLKRGRCTSTNTMEEGTSTQRQKQAKVEILGLNATKEEPEFVNSPSSLKQNNRWQSIQLSNNSGHKQTFESNSSREKGEQSSHDSKYIGTSTGSGATFEQWVPDRPDKDTLEGLVETECCLNQQGTNTTNFATIHEPPICTVEELLSVGTFDDEPNQLSPTEPMDNQNRIAPNPSTSIFTTTEGRLGHQVQIQAPGPNTSNHSTIVPENIDSNNIFEGWTDFSTEDIHASRWDESDDPIWEWDNRLYGMKANPTVGIGSYEPGDW
ncbi:uncharacterized protein LOC144545828 isoform X2 [Carex rostrata]